MIVFGTLFSSSSEQNVEVEMIKQYHENVLPEARQFRTTVVPIIYKYIQTNNHLIFCFDQTVYNLEAVPYKPLVQRSAVSSLDPVAVGRQADTLDSARSWCPISAFPRMPGRLCDHIRVTIMAACTRRSTQGTPYFIYGSNVVSCNCKGKW